MSEPRFARVVGLDLSLTSTGVSDGRSVHAVQTPPEWPTEKRLDHLVRQCVRFVLSPSQWTDAAPAGTRADLVVIEGAAFGAKGDAVDQLAGLRWIVRHRVWRLGIPFAIVAPSTLKAYTAGRGNATKAQMVEAVELRHGVDLHLYKIKEGRYDMADAYALAAMGYTRLGQPLPHLAGPPAPRKSLLATQWPEGIDDIAAPFSESD